MTFRNLSRYSGPLIHIVSSTGAYQCCAHADNDPPRVRLSRGEVVIAHEVNIVKEG